MVKPFAHLHVHTEYSLLDGSGHIKDLAKRTKALEMEHLAITDHGALYGAIEFHKACTSEGINPIIGMEAYLAGDMEDHSKRHKEDYTHLLLLARDNDGYRNLLQLATIASTKGVHDNKPRIDKRVLEQHCSGLIATSSCLAGEIPQMLLREDIEGARKVIRWYQERIGRENFFLELQEHHGRELDGTESKQGAVNKLLYRLYKDRVLGAPIIATNDLHYINPSDAPSHDVLLCVQTGQHVDSPKRKFKFDSHEYYLRSPAEMYQLFPDVPEAISNTVELIAERCHVDPFSCKASLPVFTPPPGYSSSNDYLYDLCLKGAKERYGEVTERVKQQLDYEFNLIESKGFVSYFLIQADVVKWARSRGIRCSARGSAAGSVLAYVLGITIVDPIRYQLLFERFFNPDRADMPDIDMDWPDDRRGEVINYVVNKYGYDCVSQMITFNRMAAKASVKDVARVFDEPAVGDRISRLIKSRPNMTLALALEEKELADLYKTNALAKRIIDQAMRLEGTVRSTGTHAAGVIIGQDALYKFVPMRLKDYKDPGAGWETQYEQAHLEELGLIKFDFLSLSNLTILDNALKLIKLTRREDVELERISLDPVSGDDEQNARRQKAFDLLSAGDTTGIFQLEGQEMRRFIEQLKPTCVEDVMAMIALYRPGPKDSIPGFIAAKHGEKQVEYLDARLAEWLSESYGTIVYQDQVLLIAVNLAGFGWGKVNKFRKALSKKHMDEVEGYKSDFIDGCIRNEVSSDVAEKLFELILPFGGYGFNKAHAASYAVIAFYSAYLKANYPAEFMAATLTTESQGADAPKKVLLAVTECKRLGVPVLGPNIHLSEADFTVVDGGVRFGLRAIRGVGGRLVDEIIRERLVGGCFTSLGNVCERIEKELTRGALEALIKVGALDDLGARHRLLASIDEAVQWGKSERAAKERGIPSLFDEAEDAFTFTLKKNAQEVTHKQVLNWEKEFLLAYVSGHPLDDYSVALAAKCSHTTAMAVEEENRRKVVLGGMIVATRRFSTKNGTMLIAKLEDLYGSIDVLVYSDMFERSRNIWEEGAVVVVQGEVKADQEGRETSVVCRHVEALQQDDEGRVDVYRVLLTIRLSGTDLRSVSNDMIKVNKLGALLLEHPGRDRFELALNDVFVEMDDGHRCKVRVTFDIEDNTVEYTNSLHRQVVALLGAASVEVHSVSRESLIALEAESLRERGSRATEAHASVLA